MFKDITNIKLYQLFALITYILIQSDPVIVTSDIGNPGYKQHFSKASADPMGPLMLKCSLIGNPFISRIRL